MGCNLKIFETIIGLAVVVFAYLQTDYSKYVLIIAGLVLLVHGLMCTKHK